MTELAPPTQKPPARFPHGIPSLRESLSYSLYILRANPMGELAGSLGDMGTLLPLLTAMTAAGTIDLTATLLFSGIFNIISGAVFGVPIVVQPMKAIASIAISRPLSLQETMGAGLSVGTIVLFLSITGILSWMGNRIPIPLVKGIQVGAALSLILSAGAQIAQLTWASHWSDNYLYLLFAFALLCCTNSFRRFPYALIIFIIGLIFAGVKDRGYLPVPGLNLPHFIVPEWQAIQSGFFVAGIGQLPLTILNSVIAVTYLSSDLLPERPAPSITTLGVSVGIMNMIGAFFGSMPVCHGSGGLAGQYRFGARSGASVMILGVVKVFLAFLFGSTLRTLLTHFPKSFLAVLVFAAGSELAKVGEDLNFSARDLWTTSQGEPYFSGTLAGDEPHLRSIQEQERKERFTIMLVTAGAVISVRNDAIGLLAGSICWIGFGSQKWLHEWFSREEPMSNQPRKWSFDFKRWRRVRADERQPLLSNP